MFASRFQCDHLADRPSKAKGFGRSKLRNREARCDALRRLSDSLEEQAHSLDDKADDKAANNGEAKTQETKTGANNESYGLRQFCDLDTWASWRMRWINPERPG